MTELSGVREYKGRTVLIYRPGREQCESTRPLTFSQFHTEDRFRQKVLSPVVYRWYRGDPIRRYIDSLGVERNEEV